MGETTDIGWCRHTFNPWWGCTRVSPACLHCYAEAWAKRTGHDIWGQSAERRLFGDKHWAEPLKWDRDAAADGEEHLVFCSSMADVFEERADLDEHRARLWKLIEVTRNLTWLLLTKRPQNVLEMVPERWLGSRLGHAHPWPRNVRVGTTVEDQERAAERIPHLVKVPAPVLFLSMEPLLGPVDLARVEWRRPGALSGFPPISWVITGGESGGGARPSDPEWFRSLRDQCRANGVPFFFKQLGAPWARELKIRGKGEALEDIPGDLQIREFPEVASCRG